MATDVLTPPAIASLSDPRIKEKLQELRRTDNVTNIYYLVRTYLYFAAVIGATLWFYTVNDWSFWLNAPVTLVAIVLVGAGQHQLTGLAHEDSHHILFKSRCWNDSLSHWFCRLPLYSPPQHYHFRHIAPHHF